MKYQFKKVIIDAFRKEKNFDKMGKGIKGVKKVEEVPDEISGDAEQGKKSVCSKRKQQAGESGRKRQLVEQDTTFQETMRIWDYTKKPYTPWRDSSVRVLFSDSAYIQALRFSFNVSDSNTKPNFVLRQIVVFDYYVRNYVLRGTEKSHSSSLEIEGNELLLKKAFKKSDWTVNSTEPPFDKFILDDYGPQKHADVSLD